MKKKITITTSNNQIHFYLTCAAGTGYLFSQRFTKGVYDYFRCGRSLNEVHAFCKWGCNPRSDKTIDKVVNPSYHRVAMEELAA